MSQSDNKQHPRQIGPEFLRLIGAVTGGSIAYIMTSNLSRFDSALACAVVIALLSVASTRLSHPVFWWTQLGAIAGSVIGTGSVLTDSVAQASLPREVAFRYTVIGWLSLAGLVSGISLGRNLHKTHIPRPGEFLKRASALTAGVFAVVVTIKFTLGGLEPARTLSSRLSTTTTILVTSLIFPGWIGYLLGCLQLKTKGKPPRDR